MSNYEVAELTWENGQLSMHELGGFLHNSKPTNETLESIVHYATTVASSAAETSSGRHFPEAGPTTPVLMKKRGRSDSNYQYDDDDDDENEEHHHHLHNYHDHPHRHVEQSACGSATFCRDQQYQSDATMMTWPSYESPRGSFMTKTTDEDLSAFHTRSENLDEDRETKADTVRSQSSRRGRAAVVHNQSERRRRDRINQKMKALQKLVPNASKTDKASMLDEVIEYLKQLQAQVQLMSVRNNMPQMMMPIGMQPQQQLQQHLQMLSPFLTRIGMGPIGSLGMGMSTVPQSLPQLIHPAAAVAANSTFFPHPFVFPPVLPNHNQITTATQSNPNPSTNNTGLPSPEAYCALLAQSMNMELYNKMAALYGHQLNQNTKATSNPSESNHVQGDHR